MRILSGLTPSGAIHLGNYFGAVRQWIELQDKGEAFYFIANYHALTSVRNAEVLSKNTFDVALDYLALGLDPERAVLWRQSDVHEVCELAWILTTVTPMGLLERCHAYKDKVAQGMSPDHGLFAYPVLMAADILLFDSDKVPVGEDQKQHIEVTRDIAIKFNMTYREVFKLPEEFIAPGVGRVPGVDGRKMSSSYGNDIKIFESPDKVRKKIMSIVTDSKGVDEAKDPEGNVIFELYKLMARPEQIEELAGRYRAGGMGYGHAKQALFDAFLEKFGPARERRAQLAQEPDKVEALLQRGAEKARAIARETMGKVRRAVGIPA
jgi:tryptophanyl-tRNA synthetase